MHEKLPSDENLMLRGCSTPSMCNLCSQHVESSFHIFFECPFAVNIWCWFTGCLNMTLQFSSTNDIWKLCDRACPLKNYGKQKVIWSLRNRWKNVQVLLRQMNCIVTHTYREGNEMANMLAITLVFSLDAFCFWQETPLIIRNCCVKNKLGMPNFRFST
jgi:hypothetical protein